MSQFDSDSEPQLYSLYSELSDFEENPATINQLLENSRIETIVNKFIDSFSNNNNGGGELDKNSINKRSNVGSFNATRLVSASDRYPQSNSSSRLEMANADETATEVSANEDPYGPGVQIIKAIGTIYEAESGPEWVIPDSKDGEGSVILSTGSLIDFTGQNGTETYPANSELSTSDTPQYLPPPPPPPETSGRIEQLNDGDGKQHKSNGKWSETHTTWNEKKPNVKNGNSNSELLENSASWGDADQHNFGDKLKNDNRGSWGNGRGISQSEKLTNGFGGGSSGKIHSERVTNANEGTYSKSQSERLTNRNINSERLTNENKYSAKLTNENRNAGSSWDSSNRNGQNERSSGNRDSSNRNSQNERPSGNLNSSNRNSQNERLSGNKDSSNRNSQNERLSGNLNSSNRNSQNERFSQRQTNGNAGGYNYPEKPTNTQGNGADKPSNGNVNENKNNNSKGPGYSYPKANGNMSGNISLERQTNRNGPNYPDRKSNGNANVAPEKQTNFNRNVLPERQTNGKGGGPPTRQTNQNGGGYPERLTNHNGGSWSNSNTNGGSKVEKQMSKPSNPIPESTNSIPVQRIPPPSTIVHQNQNSIRNLLFTNPNNVQIETKGTEGAGPGISDIFLQSNFIGSSSNIVSSISLPYHEDNTVGTEQPIVSNSDRVTSASNQVIIPYAPTIENAPLVSYSLYSDNESTNNSSSETVLPPVSAIYSYDAE